MNNQTPNEVTTSQIMDTAYWLLCSTSRTMPAYFTSDYNRETGVCKRPRSFGLNYDDISPVDEYELATYTFSNIPNIDLFNKNDYLLSATLMIAENIALGSFIITRLKQADLTESMMKLTIKENLRLFRESGFDLYELLLEQEIIKYFYGCKVMGQKRADLNNNEEFDCFMGLTFSDKDWRQYNELIRLFDEN